MPLPPVHPISTSEIYVIGDVTIDESAVIAPGSILQAAPDSRIVIEAGACIGTGSILNAYQGAIEIRSGAILGPGVLIIGKGSVGHHACIGATTTIFNASVEPMTVIPAGSLLGDTSRLVEGEQEIFQETEPAISEPPLEETVTELEAPPDGEPKKSPVVGQVYINQLLFTLFPERRSFKESNSNNQ